MNLTVEQNKQFLKVNTYVRSHAKTWYINEQLGWNAAITILIDIQIYGLARESALAKLVGKVWVYQEARDYILEQAN